MSGLSAVGASETLAEDDVPGNPDPIAPAGAGGVAAALTAAG